jgi:phage protein D
MGDLQRIRVEGSVHLPDMAILEFRNSDFQWSQQDVFKMGQAIKVRFGDVEEKTPEPAFDGEVCGLEIDIGLSGEILLRIRAYDRAHRLHRGRVTKVYKQVKDSDIAQEVARAVGLESDVKTTSGVHEWVLQNNQTNWEFLQERATVNGYELQVSGKKLVFKPPPSTERTSVDLAWNSELKSLRATMTTGDQVKEVEVHGWDPVKKRSVVGIASRAQHLPELEEGNNNGGQVAQTAFNREAKMVVVREPVYSQEHADRLAQSILDELAGVFITAVGTAMGVPTLQLGSEVSLQSIGKQFTGKYIVTQITHRYEPDEYLIDFEVTGRRSTDLLSLVSTAKPPAMHILNGIVSNTQDDGKDSNGSNLGRVKVKFPTLGDNIESHWCRLVSPGAGKDRGVEFIPEVDDEVLVIGPSMDNLFVLGGLWNDLDRPPYGSNTAVNRGKVEKRVIRSRTGHEVLLDDSDKPSITIVDKTKNNKIHINSTDNSLTIEADGDITLKSKQGSITIDAKLGLSTKAGTNFSAEATANATLKGNGNTSIEGSATSVRATGVVTVSGSAISLG